MRTRQLRKSAQVLGGWLGLLLVSCSPNQSTEVQQPATIPGAMLPQNFPTPQYPPEANPPDQATFELGRMLFYEPRLSRTGNVSCGSCHRQTDAFAHIEQKLSRGVNDLVGTRNAPALQNLRWRRDLLWDGAAPNLETMPVAPLTNPLEMDETLTNVLKKLNADPDYQRRFAQIYGTRPIDSYQFLRALAQFTAALTSANSRYDQYVRGEGNVQLSVSELRGRQLLTQKCTPCHGTELFTDESYRNNGLDQDFAADSGRARVTSWHKDRGRFKVPSLRNVAKTAPYMHDGRFQTLAQVLDHYDHGVRSSPTLDSVLRPANGPLGIPLTAQERTDLLAFLETLTDPSFLRDKRLAQQP